MSLTNCRFYEEKYPEIDSFVMVNVRSIRVFPLESLHLTYSTGKTGKSLHEALTSFPELTLRHQIAEMGAYVKLLEYDNIDGMILLSELSRRRIRSIQKLIRVGRNEVVVVLRVDKEKGEYSEL